MTELYNQKSNGEPTDVRVILIIDGDPLSANITEKILSRGGFQVLMADSIGHAISLVNNAPDVKLVITEIGLPDGDAFRFMKYLSCCPRLSHIPIFMCSATSDRKKILTYIKSGARDYVTKPIDPDTLISKVRNIIHKTNIVIMVVDDDECLRKVLSKSVEREGYRALTASNGREAIDIMNEHYVNAIISDIAMPEMDGFGLLAHVKTVYPDVPVLMITGHADKFTKSEITAAGADGYITKPFKNIEILNTLKSFNLEPA